MTIVFDLDGTIVDLYGVKGWLPALEAGNPRPYADAEPLVNADALSATLDELRTRGHVIEVVSWCSKTASPTFRKRTRAVKKAWCAQHEIRVDHFHAVKYGTKKQYAATCKGAGLLIDDDASVRASWPGKSVDPQQVDLVAFLRSL